MTTDVLAERARIEQQVAGRTLVDALADTVRTYPDEPAYSDKHHVPEGESWRTLTWTETRELALDVAAGLVELGVGVGDTVAIMATNRIEHFLADMGARARGGDADVDLQHALPRAGRVRRRARRSRRSPCSRTPTTSPAGPGRSTRPTA